MTRNELFQSIIIDLGANFQTEDQTLLGALLDETINDALIVSNRYTKAHLNDDENMGTHLDVLSSDIRKCVKSVYLRRGSEETLSTTVNGISLSSTFENAIDVMTHDIIRSGKRLMR